MDLIVIPSSGRPDRQQSLSELQATGITKKYKVVVLVYKDEAKKYKYMRFKSKRVKADIEVLPSRYGRGISAKRHYALTELAEKYNARYVMMIDDDLHFCWRPKIWQAYMPYTHNNPRRMQRAFAQLDRWIRSGEFAQVAFVSRQGNRDLGVLWQQPGRAMNAWAVDTKKLRKAKVKFGRVPFMEDFDITLQLLAAGYKNRISCRYGWTTVSNLKGGCSSYRTPETQLAAAKKLHRLHPEVTTLVKKKSISWVTSSRNKEVDMTERMDVRVNWQRASGGGLRGRGQKIATGIPK